MLIMTAKLPRRRLALWGFAAAALCCCALLVNIVPLQTARSTVNSAVDPAGIKTNEDRIRYLNEYGWQVKEQPLATQELIVPDSFDESYTDYLNLQAQQGFSLEKYAGKRLKRYTYENTNYPTGEQGVQVNLLVYRNTVVGGEVLSAQLDGFLHGLAMPG